MVDSPSDDDTTAPPSSTNSSADGAPARGPGPLRRIVGMLGGVGGFIVASGVIGYYFQARGWEYQAAVAKIDKDTEAAVKALNSLDEVLDEKWLSTYAMNSAVKNQVEGDKLATIVKRYKDADTEWQKRHNDLSATISMSVDAPFQSGNPAGLERTDLSHVWPLDCKSYTLAGQPSRARDLLSAGVLLEIAYHCQGMVTDSIEAQLTARDAANLAWPSTAVEPDPGGVRLSHAWWVDKVLQCILVERALEIRNSPVKVPLDLRERNPDIAAYSRTKDEREQEAKCVELYEEDPNFGAAAPKKN
jgi:hypothetical protein